MEFTLTNFKANFLITNYVYSLKPCFTKKRIHYTNREEYIIFNK